jgi:hypothetical protein
MFGLSLVSLPAMFVLGLVAMTLMFLFVVVCDQV